MAERLLPGVDYTPAPDFIRRAFNGFAVDRARLRERQLHTERVGQLHSGRASHTAHDRDC